MPPFEFLLSEFLNIVLFIACLWHAARQSRTRVLELLASLVYGVALEWMTIKLVEAYDYGQFLVMIDSAPLAIGLGWAVIIYSAMEFTNYIQMPDFARPFLVGLLALNIDAGMDAVAIRLGFWNWVIPLDQQWFGVPWGNFFAWFVVAGSFSGMLYLFRGLGWQSSARRWKTWLYPWLAMAFSLLILAGSNYLFVHLLGRSDLGGAISMLALVIPAVIVVYSTRPVVIPQARLDPVVLAVPLVYHALFTGFGFGKGIYTQNTVLAVVGVLMLVVGLGVHLWPWFAGRRGN
jgi:hypothetical protein